MADEHGLDQDRLVWMFTQMLRIREFEERVKRSFTEPIPPAREKAFGTSSNRTLVR